MSDTAALPMAEPWASGLPAVLPWLELPQIASTLPVTGSTIPVM
jgi:hypothetical protein